jgi:Raf kinase inhibitor-like YbhB/YbcL family protein
MKLVSNDFTDGGSMPEEFAFAKIDSARRVALSDDRNPSLIWSDVPAAVKSFALVEVDGDAPSKHDDVNKDDREVPADLPRREFVHWVLFDIPADHREIAAGSESDGIVEGGKPGPEAPDGFRRGVNDYTLHFVGDPRMRGVYYGYDGAYPPWNDALPHHYLFTLYALDVAHIDVGDAASGADVRAAIAGHVLAKATLTGTYTLNPRLRKS